ncbi:MAG: DNA mismatch repair protein MutS [Fusobacteriaceae bacterium]
MTQYKEIKSKNTDSVLFFRLGDFYEMFFEDAVIASKELGLTLTSRNREKGQEIPLAGIPYHSSAQYIAKLVNKGYKVAICEQVEDPKKAVGIVKRAVVRVITPGTVIDSEYLDEKSNNYLLGIKVLESGVGIAYTDITTGEFKVSEITFDKILGEINKISPKEIILDRKSDSILKEKLKLGILEKNITITVVDEIRAAEEYLKEKFKLISLESFNLNHKELAIMAAALVLRYIDEIQKSDEITIHKIEYVSSEKIVELNLATQRNLEIVENSREKTVYGTLFSVLDKCKSSMGSRTLKNFLKNPTQDLLEIEKRQRDTEFFMENVMAREEISSALKDLYDIERILGKLIMRTANGRDLIALKKSIKSALEIHSILKNDNLLDLNLEKLITAHNLIEARILDEAPFSVREGNMVKPGFESSLDELHKLSTHGKDYLLEIESREKLSTGIKNLKIKYNKVFGYFLEVSNGNKNLVPDHYIRKQTLSNAERYIVPELKEYEEKILYAKERIESLEYELFIELCEILKDYYSVLNSTAKQLAYIDVIISFATVAIKNRYVKPQIGHDYPLEIVGGRHPVVEELIGRENFVKNDLFLDSEKTIQILTGPNMAGKSTYMKQGALIILLAHIGSFVPADYAKLPVVDKIFTRIGASDDLVSGQSTFMLEMSEMANIINSATKNSFIILDEIGRGTSTFDGISIATAITEHIHNRIGAKTIFATHYHELTQLEKELDSVANYRIEVKEGGKEIVFLRKIVKGGADKSYGIEVARLAGLPKEILSRSKVVLKLLENEREIVKTKMGGQQLNLFGNILEVENAEEEIVKEVLEEQISKVEKIALEKLKELNLDSLTPLEAFMKLNELKNILG